MTADDLVIRSGHLVTMDPDLGDIPDGDVLVTGGQIAAVGTGLDAPGAREIDARAMIVAPGLVETHWHLWNTLLRSMSGGMPGEDRPRGYFSVSLGLGQAFTDNDNYQGTLLACAEAINSGITMGNDCSHNVRGPPHAEAELRALAEGRAAGPVLVRLLGRAPQRPGHGHRRAARAAPGLGLLEWAEPGIAAHPRHGLPGSGG
ncbi:MAG: hypothetical protein ACR2MP_29265, partial [Streptosporangiaceae bacterium]